MRTSKYLIIIVISILSTTDTIGQTEILNNRLLIGISAGYGSLNWTTKYSSKESNNPQYGYISNSNYKNSGTISSLDLSFLYMIRKCEFGILIGQRNYKIDELISDLSPELTMDIPDERIYLYGGLFNFEVFRLKNFKLRPEIGVGIFSFEEKSLNEFYDSQFFATSQIKFEYQMKNLNFTLAPSYEFASSKKVREMPDETKLFYKNRANSIKAVFGIAYIINMKKSSM